MRAVRMLALTAASLCAACSSPGTIGVPGPLAPSATETPSPEPSATSGERPAIAVRTPTAGDQLVSPITVAGTADVSEAHVGVRVVDDRGGELAAVVATTAQGRFSATLAFFTDRRQPGVIEVFATRAEDGSETDLVSVPVVLVPGS